MEPALTTMTPQADVEAVQSAAVDIMPQSPLFETDDNDDSTSSQSSEEKKQSHAKERHTASDKPMTIGATQVNERATLLYTRQFRGRNRRSQRVRLRAERAAREEEEGGTVANNNNEDEENPPSTQDRRRSSMMTQMVSNYFGRASVRSAGNISDTVVSAILVEEADVVVATEMGFCERNWIKISVLMTALLVILAILLSVFIFAFEHEEKQEIQIQQLEPPTVSPTFHSKPTLHTIQERGFIRCGLNNQVTTGRFYLNLCQAVASVVVGDADRYEIVPITLANRWSILNNRSADLLVGADTYTIEREVRLASAASGFTFSAPYIYDGMAYAGNETLRECAEEKKRYGICSGLSICVYVDTTSFEYLASNFPPEFYTTSSSFNETLLMMANGTCNVVASEVSLIFGSGVLMNGVGGRQFTKEPLAFVTRNNDREFSDVINWILQAAFYGEEQGLTKNATLCSNTTNVTAVASKLNYLNAVYCVGSYENLHHFPDRGMNRINNGTAMINPIPFGDLDYFVGQETLNWKDFGPRPNSTFADIINDEKLNCGVFVQNDNETESLGIVGMSTDYCRTVAASMFYGDYEAVAFLAFSSTDEAFLALQNGTIDVLAGTIVEKARDFGGYQFSTPYYYKSGTAKERLSAFALATREDDSLFSSFVNCVVLTTLSAEEQMGINEVPLASIFGQDMRWSLRDAISYSKSYDKLYKKHFGIDSVRGRNALNKIGDAGPQLHSLPGLKYMDE